METPRCNYSVKNERNGKRERCNAEAYVTINANHVPQHRCIGHCGTVKIARKRSERKNEYILTLLKQFGL